MESNARVEPRLRLSAFGRLTGCRFQRGCSSAVSEILSHSANVCTTAEEQYYSAGRFGVTTRFRVVTPAAFFGNNLITEESWLHNSQNQKNTPPFFVYFQLFYKNINVLLLSINSTCFMSADRPSTSLLPTPQISQEDLQSAAQFGILLR